MTPRLQADRLHEEGLAFLRTGRLDEALDRIGRAIDLAAETELPAQKTAPSAQQTALSALKTALSAQQTARLHNSFGAVLVELGQSEAAASSFRTALALAPGEAPAWSNLGSVATSMAAHLRALVLDPLAAAAYGNLGALAERLGDSRQALRRYRQAAALDPAGARFWSNLGSAHYWAGRLAPAGRALDRALALAPDFADARFHRGQLRLLRGDYVQGLVDYESRWERRGAGRPRLAIPSWTGEDPRGKRLLVWAEQGHGDTLQFARFVPLLGRRGAEVVLVAPRPLLPLLASLAGVARLMAPGEPLPAADFQAPLMSLPLLLGLGDRTPAPVVSYLAPPSPATPPSSLARDGRPRIGLVWAGSPANASDAWRSLDLERLRPVVALDGLGFVSLQLGARAADLAASGLADRIEATPGGLVDFAATAAVVASLDLVITVDTAMAHLAGAIGKEAWMLLTHVPDWRWGLSGETTSWYPSLRLFRQERQGDWDPVVDKLARALAERFSGTLRG